MYTYDKGGAPNSGDRSSAPGARPAAGAATRPVDDDNKNNNDNDNTNNDNDNIMYV